MPIFPSRKWPVIAEDFRQWVIEDKFCNGRPPWDEVRRISFCLLLYAFVLERMLLLLLQMIMNIPPHSTKMDDSSLLCLSGGSSSCP